MDSATDNYSYLIRKIDEFIRKFYLNKMVRGSIYLSVSLFASYTLVTVCEYYGNFDELIRSLLFFSFLLLNLGICIKFIILPLLSYFRLGSGISHEQASEIIGVHFTRIKDKLLNTLQLKKLADENPAQKALIEASINQKIAELKPVPFTSAVKIRDNRRYLRYVIPPLVVILLISFTAPSIFSEGTERLLHYNKKYIKKAPFRFMIINQNLVTVQGDDLELKVKIAGEEIPQDVYLVDGPNSFKLDKESIVSFKYVFRNLQHSKTVRLRAGEFYSDPYTIEVKGRPSLIDFNIKVVFPAYLRKKNQVFHNTGDITVPEGTRLDWQMRTGNTTRLFVSSATKTFHLKSVGKNAFAYSMKAMETTSLLFTPENEELKTNFPIAYRVSVIHDLRPSIEISEQADSLNGKSLFFIGKISDDYGFSKLKFNYRVVDKGKKSVFTARNIAFDRNSTMTSFFYSWNVKAAAGLLPGQTLEYFFEIFDNDGINGPKGARSEIKVWRLDTDEEAESKLEASAKGLKEQMTAAISRAKEVEKEAQRLNRDLLNKKKLSFDEKKQIEDLLNKRRSLENMVEEVKKKNRETSSKLNEVQEQQDDVLIAKQKQIEDLINNVLDEKTKELLKNIEQLLEQNNKTQSREDLSRMQMDSKSLQKELDRILELYKQLEFDQKLSMTIKKLNQLSEKQDKLASKTTTERGADREDLRTQQQDILNQFKDFGKDMLQLKLKNAALEQKNNFLNPASEQNQIVELQEMSKTDLKSGNMTKASGNMQSAANKMRQLSKKLEEMKEESDLEENKISLQNLREILANLLSSSFTQEKLFIDIRNTSPNDPNYSKLVQKQKELRDNLSIVGDSLYSLARKVPQIQSAVNKEMITVNENIDQALANLSERRTSDANRDQRYALTSINNLALMLSEVEEKLQDAMKNMQQNGKGNQKTLSQLGRMQEQLNRNMQKAREQMKELGFKDGQMTGKGHLTEQMARMARQQQLIRETLRNINKERSKEGKGRIEDLEKVTKDMEQTETDFVNKKIDSETMFRQQQILSKLLETEKADRERDADAQRESKEGLDQTSTLNSVLQNFKRAKQHETELFKTVPPSLSLFYQLKVGEYFRHLDSN